MPYDLGRAGSLLLPAFRMFKSSLSTETKNHLLGEVENRYIISSSIVLHEGAMRGQRDMVCHITNVLLQLFTIDVFRVENCFNRAILAQYSSTE